MIAIPTTDPRGADVADSSRRGLEAAGDPEAIGKVIWDAFQQSGSQLARRVLDGELSEGEARAMIAERSRG